MRVTQARQLEKVLTSYGEALLVRDYTFMVSTKPLGPEDGTLAATVVDCRRSCTQFCTNFFEYAPEVQRRILCHEIAHVIVRRYADAVASVEKVLGQRSWVQLKHAAFDAEEEICEHLEEVLAQIVPLPGIECGNKPMPPPSTHEQT